MFSMVNANAGDAAEDSEGRDLEPPDVEPAYYYIANDGHLTPPTTQHQSRALHRTPVPPNTRR